MHRVFMYGTLKRGQPNHYVLSEVGADRYRFVGKGYTSTKWPLVISSEHNIPYLLDKEGDGYNIKGEVYEIDDNLLAHIDQFECYPDIYGRRKIEITMTSFEKDSNGALNPDTDSKACSNPGSNVDLKSDSKTDLKVNSEVDSKADLEEDSKTHSTVDSKEDSDTNSKADSNADSKSDAKANLTTADRLNQERRTMECWIYFLPEPISPSLLELERMEDYDSYGAHGKPYIPIYVQDKGWVGELEKPLS